MTESSRPPNVRALTWKPLAERASEQQLTAAVCLAWCGTGNNAHVSLVMTAEHGPPELCVPKIHCMGTTHISRHNRNHPPQIIQIAINVHGTSGMFRRCLHR